MVVAIIQARMASTRFPGKVLKEIVGKPMLLHIVNRLKKARLVDKIVVATSRKVQDNPIEKFCRTHKICFYRGDEEDVLDRFYNAAIVFKAGVVVRITADCPLIDPQIVDLTIKRYLGSAKRYDASSNCLIRTYPRGLDTEVVPFSVLKKVWQLSDKQHFREHVTNYLYEHPGVFKVCSVENSKNLSRLRWTVDELADFKFVTQVYKRLYQKRRVFLIEDILQVVEKEPSLKKINKNIKQKRIK